MEERISIRKVAAASGFCAPAGRSEVKIVSCLGQTDRRATIEVRSPAALFPGLIERGLDTRSDRVCETDVL
jgi:hypothetical protein